MADPIFANKVAAVTGASSGIGRAVAVSLAAHGATVYLIARTAERLGHVRRCIEAQGGGASDLPGDVTDESHLVSVLDTVRRERGRLDILVHAAGAYARGNLDTATVDDLDLLYHVNVRAPYRLTQLLLPLIVPVKGQIVFVNSTVSAAAGLGAYAASKSALKAIADTLRDEVNPVGVRVVSVYPGRTNTAMQERVHALEGRVFHADRLMQPEHVAEVVVVTLALPSEVEVTNVTVRSARKS